MSGKFVKVVVAGIAAIAMLLVGSGMATAAPEAATAPTATATADGYQVEVKGLTWTFTHDQSVALYNAAKAGGAGAAGALCARFAGALGALGCSIVAAFIIDTLTDPPAPGRCYQAYPRVGIPPIGARIVNC